MKQMFLSSLILLGSFSASFVCVADDDPAPKEQPPAATTAPMATRAYLGARVAPLPPVLTSHLPDVIGKGRGILVAEVTDGSPADKAGLRVHDVLIRYDDQDLYSPEQLAKRVRNDRPGSEIELQYVRAGKISTVKLKLGEQPALTPTQRDWSGLAGRFGFPMVPYRPDFLTEDQDGNPSGTQWTRFESMSLSKGADGKYRASVKYKDEQGNSIDREFVGTRQQVRDAINADDKLPASTKEQLLRSMDDRGRITLPDLQFPGLPSGTPWPRDLFSWPDIDF